MQHDGESSDVGCDKSPAALEVLWESGDGHVICLWKGNSCCVPQWWEVCCPWFEGISLILGALVGVEIVDVMENCFCVVLWLIWC